MHFRDRQIKGTPVVTLSGTALGKVEGLVMDSDTHMIVQYVVSKASALARLVSSQELLIHRDQVISLTAERMVVQDAVVVAEKEKAVAHPKEQPAHGISATAVPPLERLLE